MINITIGNQLKRYRDLQGYSLDEIAQLTGVSKPSLSNIERGNTSPSISTLWKISKGLSVPISYFFAEKEVSYEISDLKNLQSIDSGNDLIKIFTAFKWNPADNFEVLFLELEPSAERSSKAHSSGTTEIIIPIEGEILIKILDEEVKVGTQKVMRFNADRDHQYINNGKGICKFICLMLYPVQGK